MLTCEDYFVLTSKSQDLRNFLEESIGDTQSGILKMIIRDPGCGMSGNDLTKLFRKFMQVNTDSLNRRIGAGLGLFITQEIIKRMAHQSL